MGKEVWWLKYFFGYNMQFKEMKYRCLAFGFFEDDIQVVTTSDCASCVLPRCLEYLHALTVVGVCVNYNDSHIIMHFVCFSQSTTYSY